MKIKRNLALSDSGFVFDPATGNSFTTNPLGLKIIKLLQSDCSGSKIEMEILEEYEVDSVILKRDLSDFLNLLKRLKLLQE